MFTAYPNTFLGWVFTFLGCPYVLPYKLSPTRILIRENFFLSEKTSLVHCPKWSTNCNTLYKHHLRSLCWYVYQHGAISGRYVCELVLKCTKQPWHDMVPVQYDPNIQTILHTSCKHMYYACLRSNTITTMHIQTLFSDEFSLFSDLHMCSHINYPRPI